MSVAKLQEAVAGGPAEEAHVIEPAELVGVKPTGHCRSHAVPLPKSPVHALVTTAPAAPKGSLGVGAMQRFSSVGHAIVAVDADAEHMIDKLPPATTP
jgi:hypothetical protein